MVTPLTTIHLEAVDSTQDVARHRFGGTPVLVTAARQTAGRGRTGAAWQNASRALAASLAVAPGWPVAAVPRVTLVAGLAALDVVGPAWGLKWPNDLVGAGGKAGGILTERFDAVVVVGMGLNLWWPDAPEGFAAIHPRDPGADAGVGLAVRWAESLLNRLGAGPDAWGRKEYMARCVTLGEEVTWEPDGRGSAVDITAAGGLVVTTGVGREILTSGAVHTVRRAPG